MSTQRYSVNLEKLEASASSAFNSSGRRARYSAAISNDWSHGKALTLIRDGRHGVGFGKSNSTRQ